MIYRVQWRDPKTNALMGFEHATLDLAEDHRLTITSKLPNAAIVQLDEDRDPIGHTYVVPKPNRPKTSWERT